MKIVRVDLGSFNPSLLAPGVGIWKWQKKLPLTGPPGVLRLGFLGCGAAFSSHQFQSNLLVVKGPDHLFIDAGTKFTLKLAEFGLGVGEVKNLVISHSHADHCGSVEEIGLRWRYENPIAKGGARPQLYCPPEYAQTLWQETLSGGMAYCEQASTQPPTFLSLNDYFDLPGLKKVAAAGERHAWEFSVGSIHVLMYTVPHVPETSRTANESLFGVGFIIDGKVLVSGDTRLDPQIFETLGKGCETIFQDCQSYTGGVHAGYDELKHLAAPVKKRMHLYHCDDAMRPLDDHGRLGGRDVCADGFAGFAGPIPFFYEW